MHGVDQLSSVAPSRAMSKDDPGPWGGSTEEFVRSRYAETAAMRATAPKPTLAWIVSHSLVRSTVPRTRCSVASLPPNPC